MADAPGWNETLVDRRVTYHMEVDDRLFVIENIPARTNVETGENHFSPETVERLHRIIRDARARHGPSGRRCTSSRDASA